jgi:hypothetical protein
MISQTSWKDTGQLICETLFQRWQRKRILLAVLLLLFVFNFHSTKAQDQLSTDAKISLITIGPTQREVYSAFGHSAIRVYDPQLRIDYFYNYGVFSFNQPNFYLKFAQGLNYYQLGVYDYPPYRDHYIEENRFIHEQVLNLNSIQKQNLFNFLNWNAQPENKMYLYDYFYDNCATRPRDVLIRVLADEIKFDNTPEENPITIRGLTDIYLNQQPWGDLGIDICLGMPMDKVASRIEYMFLPDSLESGFDRAKVKTDSAWIPLVSNKRIVYQDQPTESSFPLFHPWIVFGFIALAILFISFLDYKKGMLTPYLDKTIFIITGTLGWLLIILWVATSHKAAANNLNILWALPTNLIFPFIKKMRRQYFLVTSIVTAVLLLGWFALPQQLHIFLIPLVFSFGVR